jgi:hypothetical protein
MTTGKTEDIDNFRRVASTQKDIYTSSKIRKKPIYIYAARDKPCHLSKFASHFRHFEPTEGQHEHDRQNALTTTSALRIWLAASTSMMIRHRCTCDGWGEEGNAVPTCTMRSDFSFSMPFKLFFKAFSQSRDIRVSFERHKAKFIHSFLIRKAQSYNPPITF